MTEHETVEERPTKRVKTSPEPESALAGQPAQSTTLVSELFDDAVTEKETKVGITAFVSDSRPTVRGLAKKRYTDFLVNEVLPGGKILHLRTTKVGRKINEVEEKSKLEAVAPANGTKTRHESVEREVSAASASLGSIEQVVNGTKPNGEDSNVSEQDIAKLISELNEKAVAELLNLHKSILKNPKGKSRDHPTVKTEFTSDRTLRAHIHQNIRRIFNSKIDSSTNQEGILVLTAAPRRQENRPNKPRPKQPSWQERGGEYCHFTLYKENKDTMEVISLLARFLKMNPKELSFAGTKDRRAVTVQRVSARRVDAEKIAALNKTLRMAVLGDFEYASHEVGLGDLEGNEFTITLRDCTLDSSKFSTTSNHIETISQIRVHLTTAMSNLHTHGFLNYFGLQRFGTFSIRSDIVGLKLLSSDFEGACNTILAYSSDALPSSTSSSSEPSEPDNVGREDRARAEAIHLFRRTNNIKSSLTILPKRFSAESALIRHLSKHPKDFLGAILTIQHGMRSMYVHAYQSMVWNAAASHRWNLYRDTIVAGDLVLVREYRDKQNPATDTATVDDSGEPIIPPAPSDRAASATEMFERARPLSSSEAESGKYNVFDVVLPQPGFDVLYPDNASGEFYTTFMASEAGGWLDPKDMKRKQRDFSLPGAYRKVVARIPAGWDVDVVGYEGGEEEEKQFVVTDWEGIQAQNGAGDGEEVSEMETQQAKKKEEKEKENGGNENKKVAAILKFQLGTSQYATMALRELSRAGVREYKPEFSGGR